MTRHTRLIFCTVGADTMSLLSIATALWALRIRLLEGSSASTLQDIVLCWTSVCSKMRCSRQNSIFGVLPLVFGPYLQTGCVRAFLSLYIQMPIYDNQTNCVLKEPRRRREGETATKPVEFCCKHEDVRMCSCRGVKRCATITKMGPSHPYFQYLFDC